MLNILRLSLKPGQSTIFPASFFFVMINLTSDALTSSGIAWNVLTGILYTHSGLLKDIFLLKGKKNNK